MNAEPLQGALFGLALFAFAGRTLLAWLPAGEPGRHRPADLPATWAASHLLGWLAFHTAAGLASEVGLRFGWRSFALPFVALAVLRLLTLPAPMLPRHDARPERPTWLDRAALAALVLGLVAIAARALWTAEYTLPSPPAELAAWRADRPWQVGLLRLARPAHLVALAILLGHGLEALSVRSGLRRLAVLLAVALPGFAPGPRLGALVQSGHEAQLALCFGAGAAFALRWFQRADPRALALASLAFGACLSEPPLGVAPGLAGLATLAATLHRNARRQALVPVLLALVVVALPWQLVRLGLELADCSWSRLTSAAGDRSAEGLLPSLLDWRLGGPLWLLAPVLGLRAWRTAARSDRRGAAFLALLAAAALLAHAPLAAAHECLAQLDGGAWPELVLATAPVAAALVAAGLAPRRAGEPTPRGAVAPMHRGPA